MKNKYTSFEFSKKLWENGCFLDHNDYYNKIGKSIGLQHQLEGNPYSYYGSFIYSKMNIPMEFYPAYDIFWDICVKYRKEFFGLYENQEQMIQRIWSNLIVGEVDRVEAEIWENCLFNPKNKEDKK